MSDSMGIRVLLIRPDLADARAPDHSSGTAVQSTNAHLAADPRQSLGCLRRGGGGCRGRARQGLEGDGTEPRR